MSFKDLFIKPSESTTPTKQPAKGAPKTSTPYKAPGSIPSLEDGGQNLASSGFSSTSDTYVPGPDSKKSDYRDMLAKAITDDHLGHPSGPDYVEFLKALIKMADMPMDEETKFKSIFAGFEAQGVTPEKLISAGEHYKVVVSNEKTEFERSTVDLTNNTIGKAQKAIEEITAKNKSIDDQVKKLMEQKTTNNTTLGKLNTDIQTNTNMIANRKSDFQAAYTDVVSEIDKNLGLIKTHLQSPAPVK